MSRAGVPLGRADQGQPLRRGFKALRNMLGKAAALLQVVQLVGARDGAEAAGAEAHAAVAAERLVDDTVAAVVSAPWGHTFWKAPHRQHRRLSMT